MNNYPKFKISSGISWPEGNASYVIKSQSAPGRKWKNHLFPEHNNMTLLFRDEAKARAALDAARAALEGAER